MSRRPVSLPKAYEAAEKCGMTVDQWHRARALAEEARSRGRTPSKRPESSLWEPVEGQLGLWPRVEEPSS